MAIKANGAPPLPPAAPGQAQVVRKGLFEFNPARHQPGDKMLLGQHIAGGGLDEIERAVQLLLRQPACAHFISQRLAEYFVSDTPPAGAGDAHGQHVPAQRWRYHQGNANHAGVA